MKVLKLFVGLLLLLLLLGLLALGLAAANINRIVQTAVIDLGTEMLGSEVRLEAVDIQLLAGDLHLQGLSVANPAGFSNARLLEINDVAVGVDVASLLGDRILIRQIAITGAQVLAEQKLSSTNVQALQKHLAMKTGGADTVAAAAPVESEQVSGASAGPRLSVEQFSFVDASVRLLSEHFEEQQLNLPAIRLSNIGGSDGVAPSQLASALLSPLVKQVNRAVEDHIKLLAEQKVREKLRDQEDALKSKLDAKMNDSQRQQLKELKGMFGR